EKAIKIQARIASLVAAFARTRNKKEILNPKKEYSYAANFLYMLNGEEPDDIEIEAMNKALILHADHELNASTFTARVCVATLSESNSGVPEASGRLKGPLKGGGNEGVLAMLSEIDSVDAVKDYLQEKSEKKKKIWGRGHRFSKEGDRVRNT